ncbi:MAG TPA: PAS domain S-box protein, partial [Desulfobacterales bacterium]|nr:PAS domain S-box protein [Desulfobacterales bacterium]
ALFCIFLRKLIHPDEREALRQIAQKRLEGAPVAPLYEVRRLRKDGTTVWCDMMATRIEYRGRPAIMGNIMDITKRRQAEEGLRESEKLLYQEERRIELLRFANDVALKLMHELRNPLVTIGGFSRRISTRDCSEEKLKEYAGIIFKESTRLDNVLNKVLAHLKTAAEQR